MALDLNRIHSYLHIIKVPFLFEKVKVVNVNMLMANDRASYFLFFFTVLFGNLHHPKKIGTFVDLVELRYLRYSDYIIRIHLNQ